RVTLWPYLSRLFRCRFSERSALCNRNVMDVFSGKLRVQDAASFRHHLVSYHPYGSSEQSNRRGVLFRVNPGSRHPSDASSDLALAPGVTNGDKFTAIRDSSAHRRRCGSSPSQGLSVTKETSM